MLVFICPSDHPGKGYPIRLFSTFTLQQKQRWCNGSIDELVGHKWPNTAQNKTDTCYEIGKEYSDNPATIFVKL